MIASFMRRQPDYTPDIIVGSGLMPMRVTVCGVTLFEPTLLGTWVSHALLALVPGLMAGFKTGPHATENREYAMTNLQIFTLGDHR